MESEKVLTVIFDLDGTIVDSKKSIFATFETILDEYNIDRSIVGKIEIGQTLDEMILNIFSDFYDYDTESIKSQFKDIYDHHAYKNTEIFNGIENQLNILKNSGCCDLFLATNKREIPTKKILEFLNIEKYFNTIICVDTVPQKSLRKSEMIDIIINQEMATRHKCVYVGDTTNDRVVAEFVNINFIEAFWNDESIFHEARPIDTLSENILKIRH